MHQHILVDSVPRDVAQTVYSVPPVKAGYTDAVCQCHLKYSLLGLQDQKTLTSCVPAAPMTEDHSAYSSTRPLPLRTTYTPYLWSRAAVFILTQTDFNVEHDNSARHPDSICPQPLHFATSLVYSQSGKGRSHRFFPLQANITTSPIQITFIIVSSSINTR